MAGPSDLVLYRNVGLTDTDTGGQTSTVGEPSIANGGRELLMTGNWYASRSLDGGNTWSYVSPFNFFPPANGGFCCDQTALYDPSRNLMFWLLQYVSDGARNTLRVAVKRIDQLGSNVWHWWDLVPDAVNTQWSKEWFDYNHSALSNNYLYIGSNAFTVTNNRWTRCVVFKLALDELADSGAAPALSYFQTSENFSLRCVQGARDVMYMGSHVSNSQLRVFSWPETSSTVGVTDVPVSAWSAGDYDAPGPDGRNWLTRCDPRITGAWVANGRIGFMWSANSRGQARPFPYVRVVRMEEGSKAVVDEPDIWNSGFAYAYPEACPNDRGHLGVTLFRGGGSKAPAHVVGILDDYTNLWELTVAAQGTDGPADGKWGDYLAIRRHSPDGLTWLASGFVLQGGGTRDEVEPRVVHFGRRRDAPAVERWLLA